ncbi:hypothetical protein RHABOEDO_000860 [Candidatus Rhabdochlamydia oedothoracis]|uniref:Uncharacterized protein n=1 Tax=Candidatus Rhabdochlamydia oedothoracis TaxID=2720720 RepID=A0ABX8V0B8_9BACT|nr:MULTISPECIES: hypothetical protein [Rhabdochlamydia]KAG6558707.1 hypothetical protein RHOW815_001303 [Candidatus Rhabdochlamydia sp. W815]MCL6756489.1 hypothetical protein [Candidatus Rhabdochlamydia oedothoracis]QYF48659.1 hypothetical protein RHABOEDO_000860 [Candidatus Rhabdochlamydia oedothoracis]
MSIEVGPTNIAYQNLTEPTSTTILSRIRKRFTVKDLAILSIGTSVVGVADFPHDGAFSYYCKESCSLLYKFNIGMQ